MLSGLAKSWLGPNYPFRQLAFEQGPAATGFSCATLASGLDSFFKQLTKENFHALLEQDLGHICRLDAMVFGDDDCGRIARTSQPLRKLIRTYARERCRIPR